MLEVLVHVDEGELPPGMFIMNIEIADGVPVLEIPVEDLPTDWRLPENIVLKELGDKIFEEKKFLAIKAGSAVLPDAYNYILNPLYPRYYELVKVVQVKALEIDKRLL